MPLSLLKRKSILSTENTSSPSGLDKHFWLLSLAMFFFMAGFNLILPELNNFITLLDGADQKGLIITLFSVSAGLSRPFSGKLSDKIGRKKVIYGGIALSFLVSLLYPLSHSVLFFLALRVLHGFSAGFAPTGATALLTDLIPAHQRGKAMGIWGTFISLGIGAGQALGSWIYQMAGFNVLFATASAFSIVAILISHNVRETLVHKVKFKPQLLKVKWADVFEPSVLPAAMVMMLTATCSGVIFVVTPDISAFLGIENKGFFFGIYVIATVVVRLFTSSLSDKIGRRQTMLIGCSFLLVSMILIAEVVSYSGYIIGALTFGIATGIGSPTLFAWTADLSHEDRRGVGAGTMFIALEIGIMIGSVSTLFTYNNTAESIHWAFSTAILTSILAIAYLIWHLKTQASRF
jgi:MFS family permease